MNIFEGAITVTGNWTVEDWKDWHATLLGFKERFNQRRPDEATCQICSGANPVWFAPNSLWNKVIDDQYHYVCPVCFIEKAEALGIVPTGWKVEPES